MELQTSFNELKKKLLKELEAWLKENGLNMNDIHVKIDPCKPTGNIYSVKDNKLVLDPYTAFLNDVDFALMK